MGNVRENEVLFCEGFVEQVLYGYVHVAIVVWINDFPCEIGQ
jgi:hypothetical protein